MNPRATADGLRKTGQYAAAAEAYGALWPDGDPWTGWAYALCLRKIKKSEEAVIVARAVLDLAPDFELGRSVYAWALFDTLRKAENLSLELVGRAEKIVELTANTETAHDRVSPFVPTVLIIAKLLAAKGKHGQVLYWLRFLDPNCLALDEFTFLDSRGKHRRLASQRERYHSLKTYALEKLQRWQECLKAAETALRDCKHLHHDNDIWFARRAARAKVRLGDSAAGIAELEGLAARKATSFIYFDIAETAWLMNEEERSFKNCIMALQSPGDIEYKLPAVLLLARILWRKGKLDEARDHLLLYIKCRQEKGWRIDSDIEAMLAEWDANPRAPNAAGLLSHVKGLWRKWSSSAEVRRYGVVQSLLPHGRAGFIVDGKHERFYFDTRDWKDRRDRLIQGSRVTFKTKAGYDRKRQRVSLVACEIREGNSSEAPSHSEA